MTIEEQRRARFEAWWKQSGMTKFKDTAEAAWNAAMDSVEIALPPRIRGFKPEHQAHNAAVDTIARSIEAAGLKVK